MAGAFENFAFSWHQIGPMRWTFLLLLPTGCVWITEAEYNERLGGPTETNCNLQVWFTDADGDGYGDPNAPFEACTLPSGYVANDADCDDSDPTRNPQTVWYLDADGDGYGAPDATAASCEPLEGYTRNAQDCDDTRAAVNPDATEDCDTAADDNCDGDTDAEDALNCLDWYLDADGDGYGDIDTVCTCEEPEGTVAAGGDCDDTDPAVSPDGTEVCNDGIDNDCDGTAGECGLSGAITVEDDAQGVLTGVDRNDYTGLSLSVGDDLLGDGQVTLVISNTREDHATTDEGSVYLHSGVVSGEVSLEDAVRLDGSKEAGWFGYSSASADWDGDGHDDLIVGAPIYENGAAYWFAGPVTDGLRDVDAELSISGESTGDRLGWTMAAVGDTNGDGIADFLVGAYGSDVAGSTAGAAYLYQGATSITEGHRFLGDVAGDRAGFAVAAAGDVDGDGLQDLMITADRADTSVVDAGKVYVLLGPATGVSTLEDADWVLSGSLENDFLGESLASAGDVNNDGLDEILVGAPARSAAFLIGWRGGGSEQALDVTDAIVQGSSNEMGAAILPVGDVDGDGFIDMAFGAPAADVGGETWLMYGPLTGLNAVPDARFTTDGADATLGYSLAAPGDVNGDGRPDLYIGAPNSSWAEQNAGGVWLLLGSGL